MEELILKSKGIKTDQYFIPPFELRKGELVVINLNGGAHYHYFKEDLADIFTGKISNKNVTIFQPLTFVKHFVESRFRRIFYSTSVGEYLKENADLKSDFAKKIYETSWMNKNIKVKSLFGNQRKLLTLFATLSKTNNIVFDFVAVDPEGAKYAYEIIKNEVRNGGSAIFIDWTDEMKDDCTKYIAIEWLVDFTENKKVIQF